MLKDLIGAKQSKAEPEKEETREEGKGKWSYWKLQEWGLWDEPFESFSSF